MTCQNYECNNETEGYDMFCIECQEKDDKLFQEFVDFDNKKREK